MTVSIGDIRYQTKTTLANKGVNEASIEADLILSLTLGIERAQLYSSFDNEFPDVCRTTIQSLIQRRVAREPLAYILGNREFYGINFMVGQGVFIPRPETETLVEKATDMARCRYPYSKITIADVGTGSGAIAISIAMNLPYSHIFATDITKETLSTAKVNAQTNGVQGQITFLRCDLLTGIPEPVDLIVANLPYIRSQAIPLLEPEISWHEPLEALDGGVDGLDLIRRLLSQSRDALQNRGAIFLEMDPEQISIATSDALDIYPAATVYKVNDLAGLDRILVVDITHP